MTYLYIFYKVHFDALILYAFYGGEIRLIAYRVCMRVYIHVCACVWCFQWVF